MKNVFNKIDEEKYTELINEYPSFQTGDWECGQVRTEYVTYINGEFHVLSEMCVENVTYLEDEYYRLTEMCVENVYEYYKFPMTLDEIMGEGYFGLDGNEEDFEFINNIFGTNFKINDYEK
jgi:hypothetical protein